MSFYEQRMEKLETAKTVDEQTYQEHMTGFVKSFVLKDRQERWLYLLLKKLGRLNQDSHKIYGDLDRSRCLRIKDHSIITQMGQGVYYRFSDDAKWLFGKDAFFIGHDHGGIFSVGAGELAVFFFHESEDFMCKK